MAAVQRVRDGLELRALLFSLPCEYCAAHHEIEGASRDVGDHRVLEVDCESCGKSRVFRFAVDAAGPSDVSDQMVAAYAAHFAALADGQGSDARGYATRLACDSKAIAAYERAADMARAAGAAARATAYDQAKAVCERDRDAATPPR